MGLTKAKGGYPRGSTLATDAHRTRRAGRRLPQTKTTLKTGRRRSRRRSRTSSGWSRSSPSARSTGWARATCRKSTDHELASTLPRVSPGRSSSGRSAQNVERDPSGKACAGGRASGATRGAAIRPVKAGRACGTSAGCAGRTSIELQRRHGWKARVSILACERKAAQNAGMKRARTTVEATTRESLLLGRRPPVEDLVRVASHADSWSTVLERCCLPMVDLELGGAGRLMPGGRWRKRRCWARRRLRRHGATRGQEQRLAGVRCERVEYG